MVDGHPVDHENVFIATRHKGTKTEAALRAAGAFDDLDPLLEVLLGDGDILVGKNGSPIALNLGNGQVLVGRAGQLVAELYELDSLDDLNVSTPLNQHVLRYDSGTSKWIKSAPDFLVMKGNTGNSTVITNTVTETTFSQTLSVVGNTLAVVGRKLRVTCSGKVKRNGTDTVILRLKFGGVTLWTSEAFDAGSAADITWSFVVEGMMRSSGAIAPSQTQGFYGATLMVPSVFSGTPTSITTDSTQTLTVTAEWDNASVNNQIQLFHLDFEAFLPNAQQA